LTHLLMRAWSAPARLVTRLPVGPDHGIDDGPAAGCDEGNRDPLSAASKADKGKILDELCATTGWHRNHARKALGQALRPKVVRPRRVRPPTYGPDVVVALRFCWAEPPNAPSPQP